MHSCYLHSLWLCVYVCVGAGGGATLLAGGLLLSDRGGHGATERHNARFENVMHVMSFSYDRHKGLKWRRASSRTLHLRE